MKYSISVCLCIFTYVLQAQTVSISFASQSGNFCEPSQIQFTQQTTGKPVGFVWDFGDGNNSYTANPSHTYSTAGTYTVNLIAIFEKTTVTATTSITIHKKNSVSVTADRNFICRPGDISFTAAGNAEVNYEWNYGDGSSGSTAVGTVTHTFNSFRNFNVTVKATDTAGCDATASVSVTLKNPDVSGTFSPRSGCIPASSGFSASAVIPSGSSVTNYLWDFGDGTTANTSVGSVSHSYTARGSYSPKLSITTSEGCTADFTFPSAAFGTPPININAYAVNDTICASDPASLVGNATGANQYYWDFGDGKSGSTGDTAISHKYDILGLQNVTVVPYDNGCSGNSASFPVMVIGVQASFGYTVNCTSRDKAIFSDYSLGNITSFLWDYGDGQQNDSVLSPIHSFPSSGSFWTTLTIKDSVTGCSSNAGAWVYTAIPSFKNADSVLCRNSATTFEVANDYSNPSSTYTYHVAGTVTSPLSASSVTVNAVNFGTFDNYVVIDNGFRYCKDTAFLDHKILVRGPALTFTADSALCIYDSTSITNTSVPYIAGDSITSWKWKMGDSLFSTSYQPQSYRFPSTGNYNAVLYATDVNGCSDSLAKTVIVNGIPFLRVVPEADTLCAGIADTLMAFHNNPITWTSNQGVGCVDCDTIVVSPNASAYYAISSQTPAGCFARDTINVKVYSRFAAQALNPLSYICPGDTISLHVLPDSLDIRWSPSMGLSTSSGYDPVASPYASTQYTAFLTDSAGCFSDSISFDVNVKSAGIVNAGPDTVVNYYSNFAINPTYSNNIVKYEWSPPGDLDCIFCGSPTGQALDSYIYTVTATTDSGCIVRDSIGVFIECNQASILLPNAFTPNNDQLNDVLYPVGRGISIINKFSIYDRRGTLVFVKSNFKANDPANGWDGRVNGEPASSAVYVYTIEATCAKGESLLKKGTVVLLR